ncbi:C40 family peptidase [Bifidobacterium gallicum]|uniref:NlpC/P60 family protein n=1 Tax=Bifidobacterium gallicum DSM 20093 = LMG 11596 TaxID=561180 RepID=D1NV45_9BIFI|nr:C40 family peptidase [Bifidobacterium gallicum]EFA22696.1 NlpC/P60 family protein [Bifidobacterium gallicum DSM 20093 = LMG 11596]KFI59648.1 peptidase P60 [Bifidobacterium gallicum DSM 20093 = LMG 11596]
MNTKKRFSALIAACAAALTLSSAAVPAAFASDSANDAESMITSARSFPKVNTVKKNLYVEASSTSVDEDSNWGGVEKLDVPQTKSTAEKEAEAAAAAAAAQAEAERKAQEEAAAAASRAQARESLNQQPEQTQQAPAAEPAPAAVAAPAVPTSGNGAAVASLAMQYQGAPYVYGGTTPAGWDCSGFVMWVYSQFGVSLPHSSGAQMGVGTAVPSLAQAQPGDIIANGSHAAIYIGNGMVINALNPAQGTQVTSTAVFNGGFAIRRVL